MIRPSGWSVCPHVRDGQRASRSEQIAEIGVALQPQVRAAPAERPPVIDREATKPVRAASAGPSVTTWAALARDSPL